MKKNTLISKFKDQNFKILKSKVLSLILLLFLVYYNVSHAQDLSIFPIGNVNKIGIFNGIHSIGIHSNLGYYYKYRVDLSGEEILRDSFDLYICNFRDTSYTIKTFAVPKLLNKNEIISFLLVDDKIRIVTSYNDFENITININTAEINLNQELKIENCREIYSIKSTLDYFNSLNPKFNPKLIISQDSSSIFLTYKTYFDIIGKKLSDPDLKTVFQTGFVVFDTQLKVKWEKENRDFPENLTDIKPEILIGFDDKIYYLYASKEGDSLSLFYSFNTKNTKTAYGYTYPTKYHLCIFSESDKPIIINLNLKGKSINSIGLTNISYDSILIYGFYCNGNYPVEVAGNFSEIISTTCDSDLEITNFSEFSKEFILEGKTKDEIEQYEYLTEHKDYREIYKYDSILFIPLQSGKYVCITQQSARTYIGNHIKDNIIVTYINADGTIERNIKILKNQYSDNGVSKKYLGYIYTFINNDLYILFNNSIVKSNILSFKLIDDITLVRLNQEIEPIYKKIDLKNQIKLNPDIESTIWINDREFQLFGHKNYSSVIPILFKITD